MRQFIIEITIPDESVFGDQDLLNWLGSCCEYGFDTTERDEYTNAEWKVREV